MPPKIQKKRYQFKTAYSQADLKKLIELSRKAKEGQEQTRIRKELKEAEMDVEEEKKKERERRRDLQLAQQYLGPDVFETTGADYQLYERMLKLAERHPKEFMKLQKLDIMKGMMKELRKYQKQREEEGSQEITYQPPPLGAELLQAYEHPVMPNLQFFLPPTPKPPSHLGLPISHPGSPLPPDLQIPNPWIDISPGTQSPLPKSSLIPPGPLFPTTPRPITKLQPVFSPKVFPLTPGRATSVPPRPAPSPLHELASPPSEGHFVQELFENPLPPPTATATAGPSAALNELANFVTDQQGRREETVQMMREIGRVRGVTYDEVTNSLPPARNRVTTKQVVMESPTLKTVIERELAKKPDLRAFEMSALLSERGINGFEIHGKAWTEIKSEITKQKNGSRPAGGTRSSGVESFMPLKGKFEDTLIGSVVKRFNILMGELQAGNHSKEIKDELYDIIDFLLRNKRLTKPQHKKIVLAMRLNELK